MFKALNKDELDIVIDAMAEKRFNAGEVVIKQGDAGAVLQVVEEGQLECFKKFGKDEEPKYLKT